MNPFRLLIQIGVVMALCWSVVAAQKVDPTATDSLIKTHKTFVFFPFQVKTKYKVAPPGLTEGTMSSNDYAAMFSFQRAAASVIEKGKDGPYTAEVGNCSALNKRLQFELGDSAKVAKLQPGKIKDMAMADAYFLGFISKQDNREPASKNTASANMLGGPGSGSGSSDAGIDWKITLLLFDAKTGRQLWKYDDTYTQSAAEKEESIAASFARKLAKRIPYKWKNK